MKKHERPQIVLADWIADREKEESLDVVLPGGESITFPPAVLWPPPADGDETNNLDYMIQILGAEQFEKFIAAGGSWLMFNRLLVDARGMVAGE